MKRIQYEHEGRSHELSRREVVAIHRIGRKGPTTREDLCMMPERFIAIMEARGLLAHRETAPLFVGLASDGQPPILWRRPDVPGRDRYYDLTPLGVAIYRQIEAEAETPNFARRRAKLSHG